MCGDRDAHGHITKRGTHPLNPHFARVAVRRGHKAAVVAVAHRLCPILFAMVRDGSEFDPARLGVEEGHFTRAVTCGAPARGPLIHEGIPRATTTERETPSCPVGS